MGSGSEWEELVQAIAQELKPFLQTTLWIRRYENHVDRIRSMSAPSEKLVYLYLLISQPQSFTTIRRTMALNRRTVDQDLLRLMKLDHIHLDDRYLYWITEPAA